MGKSEQNRDRLFKAFRIITAPITTRSAGAFVISQDNPVPEQIGHAAERYGLAVEQQSVAAVQPGFTTEDILWSLGIWSVIVSLSPVLVFYVLMVA